MPSDRELKVRAHLDVLDLHDTIPITKALIRKAYHELSLKYHPDKAGPESTGQFQKIQGAHEWLIGNPEAWPKALPPRKPVFASESAGPKSTEAPIWTPYRPSRHNKTPKTEPEPQPKPAPAPRAKPKTRKPKPKPKPKRLPDYAAFLEDLATLGLQYEVTLTTKAAIDEAYQTQCHAMRNHRGFVFDAASGRWYRIFFAYVWLLFESCWSRRLWPGSVSASTKGEIEIAALEQVIVENVHLEDSVRSRGLAQSHEKERPPMPDDGTRAQQEIEKGNASYRAFKRNLFARREGLKAMIKAKQQEQARSSKEKYKGGVEVRQVGVRQEHRAMDQATEEGQNAQVYQVHIQPKDQSEATPKAANSNGAGIWNYRDVSIDSDDSDEDQQSENHDYGHMTDDSEL